MNDVNLQPGGPRPLGAATGSARPAELPAMDGGIAFRALLERLQARADELDRRNPTVDDPAKLAGALDVARASLTDACSLSARLLEAFREAHLRGPADGGAGAR